MQPLALYLSAGLALGDPPGPTRGLRNAEGFAFVPETNTLWASANNRDESPYPNRDATNRYGLLVRPYIDNYPADEFTYVHDGGNYGWPYCNPTQDSPSGFVKMKFDSDMETNRDGAVDCRAMDPIDRGLQANSVLLQLAFAQQTVFPAVYRDYVSWDRVEQAGYKVVYLPWNPVNGKPGRPVDLVANLADISFRVIGELPYTARVVFAACGYALAATITKGDDGITYLSLDGAGIRGAEPGRFAGFKSDGKTMEEHPKR